MNFWYYSVPIHAGDFIIISVQQHQNIVNALEIVYSQIDCSHGRACGKLVAAKKNIIWIEPNKSFRFLIANRMITHHNTYI